MGIFGKLFEKKTCSICGGEIGLLGNRKLEDGNLCKNCNAKLSPFFDERRHSTIEMIQEHLNYREDNQEALKEFHPTRTFGGSYQKMHVDEAARTFVVSGSRKWREENPDVVPMSEIADVRMDISDSRTEIKREKKDAEGNTEYVSYNPPRYRYSYNFYLNIEMVESFKWFNRIRIPLNNSTIEIEPSSGGFMGALLGGTFDPHMNPQYTETERLGNEMTQLLMGSRYTGTNVQTTTADPNAPQMVECEYCGTKFTSDGTGKCPYCGANL